MDNDIKHKKNERLYSLLIQCFNFLYTESYIQIAMFITFNVNVKKQNAEFPPTLKFLYNYLIVMYTIQFIRLITFIFDFNYFRFFMKFNGCES
jgi:hypothetical protein